MSALPRACDRKNPNPAAFVFARDGLCQTASGFATVAHASKPRSLFCFIVRSRPRAVFLERR